MTKKNQFWKGMLYGAIAGGAISLFDRDTRQLMKEHIQKAASQAGYIVRNPKEITKQVKETALKIKATIEEVSEDISYITEKVDELREITPQVTDILKETKDAFKKGEGTGLIEEIDDGDEIAF
jgi:gas vesicle protein